MRRAFAICSVLRHCISVKARGAQVYGVADKQQQNRYSGTVQRGLGQRSAATQQTRHGVNWATGACRAHRPFTSIIGIIIPTLSSARDASW